MQRMECPCVAEIKNPQEITMSTKPTAPKAPMTQTAAARIQSVAAKGNGGQTPKGSFASRAARAAAHNGK